VIAVSCGHLHNKLAIDKYFEELFIKQLTIQRTLDPG